MNANTDKPDRIPGLLSATRAIAALFRQPAVAALSAFMFAIAIAFLAALLVEQQWQSAAQQRFTRRTAQISTLLLQQLSASEAILLSARALLDALPALSEDRWQRYFASLDPDADRSPVAGIGYAPLIASAAPSALRDAPPFAMTLYAPAGVNAVPHVVAADPATHAALARAAASGDVALSAARSNDTPDGNAALTLYLPVYAHGDATGSPTPPLAGFLVAPLKPGRLVGSLGIAGTGIALTVRAGDPPFDLHTGNTGADEAPAPSVLFHTTDTFAFGGTSLNLDYRADGSPTQTGAAQAATTVLVAGAACGAALAWLASLLASRRAKSANASRSGATLNEARMMGIIRSSMEAIVTIDETQRIVIFNPMAESVFGISAMDAVGQPLGRFIPERFRAAHEKHVEQFGVTGVTERQMGRQQRVLYGLRANGEEFPIEASISQIRDSSGKLYTVMLRDITERLRAENSLKHSREELRELSANLQNVREAEKTRIARELHDDLGQQLTALKMDLSAIEQAFDAAASAKATGFAVESEQIVSRLCAMRRLIDSTVASVRRIAADLRPVMLDDLGLVPAIEWLANDFTNRYGIDIERHLDPGATAFSNAGATTLFRIVQEALTNVARHADATRVVLTLEVDDELCRLRIADNGRGAVRDGNKAPTGHVRRDKSFGLLGIRERAHMLGGPVTIDTGPGEGFAITVSFPLKALQPEATLS